MKVICFLFDPNVGGPTIRARAVYSKLKSDNYDITVAFPREDGSALSYMHEGGIHATRIAIDKPVLPRKVWPFAKYVVRLPLNLLRLMQFLRREKPDVIHVNGAFDVLPPLAARLTGTPVVWHLNDTLFSPGLSKKMGWLVMKLATKVVAAATRVADHYGVTKANPHIIFAPVDTSKFYKRDQNAERQTPPRLTLIGNWNWIKGHDHFVSLIEQFHHQNAPVQGLIVGRFLDSQKSYWQPIMQRIEQSCLSDTIETPGFVADVNSILYKTDILLITSVSEASPISLLEAMSVGVPVVSFDVGGVREMLGEGAEAAGRVVPAGDQSALYSATKAILENKTLYQEMAARGQNRARDKFSLDVCVQKHKLVYEAALSNKLQDTR